VSAPSTKILLVDNDETFAMETRQLLGEIADVVWVASSEHALELLLTRDWNILMAEVELPAPSGLELVRASRLRDPAPVALVLSDHERFEYAVEALRAGASDYIDKSIAARELLAKVQHAMALDGVNRARRAPSERVLAIGAHPDDVEVGCGGILLRHRDAGQAITILTLTGGEGGGRRAVRVAEARRAAALLSAQLRVLAFDDTDIPRTQATVRAISAVVEEVQPTTIYTHTDRDVHQDHRSVHRAVIVAARAIPRVYAYEGPSATVDFRPSRFVSIDGVLERKLALIATYSSQTQIRDYLTPDLLRATARYWGRFGSSDHAEALEVIREGDLFDATGTRVLKPALMSERSEHVLHRGR
jgi:LmbE family N-acetylglucosaminyl deacetylase/CheY-like chemotaxis protein